MREYLGIDLGAIHKSSEHFLGIYWTLLHNKFYVVNLSFWLSPPLICSLGSWMPPYRLSMSTPPLNSHEFIVKGPFMRH